MLGFKKQAIEDWSKVIELNPKNSEAYILIGRDKLDLKDYRGAIKDLNKAIEFDAENAVAHYYRGVAKLYLHQNKGACQDFNKAGELGFARAFEAMEEFCK